MKLLSTFILMLLFWQGPCCQAAQKLLADCNLRVLDDETELPISNLPSSDQEATDIFDNNLEDNLDFIQCTFVTPLIISETTGGYNQNDLLLPGSSYPPFLPPETLHN